MSKRRNSTSAELIAMHDELMRGGFIAVTTLPGPGNRSQLDFPQGFDSEPVQEYLRAIKLRADNAG